jgi:hypothetical protein
MMSRYNSYVDCNGRACWAGTYTGWVNSGDWALQLTTCTRLASAEPTRHRIGQRTITTLWPRAIFSQESECGMSIGCKGFDDAFPAEYFFLSMNVQYSG